MSVNVVYLFMLLQNIYFWGQNPIYNSFNILFCFYQQTNHHSTHSLQPFNILRFITVGFFKNK